MLSSLLTKKQCASCKFCCSFRRQSLWETPLFPPEVVEKLSQPNEYGVVGEFRTVDDLQKSCAGRLVLENNYRTADPEEEVPCTFLDPERGCILKPEDKPFDCSIWPLRIMNKDGELVIALTPTCPSIGAVPSQALTELVKSGLGEKILEYAKEHPYIIKEYRAGFPIIYL
jgi:Fe-S-cluster containining protein